MLLLGGEFAVRGGPGFLVADGLRFDFEQLGRPLGAVAFQDVVGVRGSGFFLGDRLLQRPLMMLTLQGVALLHEVDQLAIDRAATVADLTLQVPDLDLAGAQGDPGLGDGQALGFEAIFPLVIRVAIAGQVAGLGGSRSVQR